GEPQIGRTLPWPELMGSGDDARYVGVVEVHCGGRVIDESVDARPPGEQVRLPGAFGMVILPVCALLTHLTPTGSARARRCTFAVERSGPRRYLGGHIGRDVCRWIRSNTIWS